jgi:hypothetical protein
VNKDRKYFRVKTNGEAATIELALELILKKAKLGEEALRRSVDLIKRTEGRGENSPWLERTGWKRTFAGKDMKDLMGYVNIDDGLELS